MTENIIASKLSIIIISVLIFIIALKVLHIAHAIMTKKILKQIEDSERTKEINTIAHILKSAIDVVLWLAFAMFLLTKLGIDIRPFMAAAGVLGVAVGFGAKRFIEDIITGLVILSEGQIRVGDIVEINNRRGIVEKIDLKMVVLRDMQGCVHYIRNGMIDVVTNMTRDFSYYVLDLTIAYKENINKVIDVLNDVFQNELMQDEKMACEILEKIEILGLDSFKDSGIVIKSRIKTKPMQQWKVGREFNKLIKERFEKENIEIPFPHQKVLLKNND